MRKLGVAVAIILILIVAVALALPHLIDVNQYRGQIQAELQKRLNRPVQLGEMSLSILPLEIKIAHVSIGEDPSFHSTLPFANVGQLNVSVKLFALLRKEVAIDSLTLKNPQIELIRNAQGVWNFASLGQNSTAPQAGQVPPPQAAPPSQPAKPSPAQGSASAFSLSKLRISDGQIAVTDYQKHQSRSVYDHIDLTLSDFAPNQPFSIDAAAHLPGSGSQKLELSGKGGPINDQQLLNTPFDGTVKMDQVSLAGAQKFLNSASLANTDAVISGSTDLSNRNGKMSAKGSLKFENAVIHGTSIGYPVTADFDLTNDLLTDSIQIRQGALKLGSTPLSILGTMDSKVSPAILDITLMASNASIEEAARLAAAFGLAFNPNTKIAGQVTANVRAQGPSDKPVLNGNVSARNLQITGSDIPQPVRVPAIDLAMTPQDIRSNPFTATSGGTTVAVQLALSQYATPAPNVDAAVKTVNGKVDELLGIAKAYGVTSLEGTSGSGNISLDLHAVGPIKDANALKFNGSGALQNASLKTPALTQPVNIRNATLQFTENSANLTNLSASLGSTNATGNLSIANFQAPHLTFALNADKVNVAELEKITGGQTAPPAKKRATLRWSLVPAADAAPASAPEPSLLTTATGSGTIAIGNLLYEQTELTNVHSNVTLDHGIVRLNPVTAQVYGGQENGSITVDARRTPMAYAVNAKLTGVDANKLLSSMSSVKDTLYGLLAGTSNVTFATPASGDIMQTLNGTLALNLKNGKLTKLDLLNELGKIGKFTGGNTAAKGYTNISQLSGTFNIRNGVAQTNDLKAAVDGGTMAATGLVNLVSQDLNMHVTAVLDKGFSQTVGGTGIGGYLNTALANKNGELVLPVLITGNLNHPVVAPDVQQIAQMKMKNLLPTAAGVLSGQQRGVPGILGSLLGGQQTTPGSAKQGGQPAQQLNNPLGSALNQLLGGNKKKPQR